MALIVLIVHLFIALGLVGLVLMQRSEGGALGMGGGSGSIISGRGAADILARMTTVAGAIFFVTSLSLTMMAGRGREGASVLDRAPATAPIAAPAPIGPPAQPVEETLNGVPAPEDAVQRAAPLDREGAGAAPLPVPTRTAPPAPAAQQAAPAVTTQRPAPPAATPPAPRTAAPATTPAPTRTAAAAPATTRQTPPAATPARAPATTTPAPTATSPPPAAQPRESVDAPATEPPAAPPRVRAGPEE